MVLKRRYNLQLKTPELMDHYLFYIPWSQSKEMEVYQPPYTESPLIQTNICSGTATIPLPTGTVLLTLYYIELPTSAPIKNKKKKS